MKNQIFQPTAPAGARLTADIWDNQSPKTALANFLAGELAGANALRLVSAYFSVHGFAELAAELESLPQVKFLFGEPSSIAQTQSGDTEYMRFGLTKDGLSLQFVDILAQRAAASRCAAWIGKESVLVRTIAQSNFLHGKMWHIQSGLAPGGENDAVAIGSSNFTKRGLGRSQNANIELNIAVQSPQTREALRGWFDDIWDDDKKTEDAKPKLLAALERWHKNHAPEFIYYKTLFELFHDSWESRAEERERMESSRLQDSQIWEALHEFQKDGAKSVIGRLSRHNGCILADSVGLGKTYTALAVIKFFELRNSRVLVLAPKKLDNNWRVYKASAAAANNPFAADRFSYHLLAHTDLTRNSGMSGDINLKNFNWGAYDLVVLDESHNFRNETKSRRDDDDKITRHSRYERLLNEVIKASGKTKVLMLSATPVNTSLMDLRNQIQFITEGRADSFAESLGVENIDNTFKQAQKKFAEWEKRQREERRKEDLLEQLGGDFLHLLGGLTIARSRAQIKKFYIKDMTGLDFPRRESPDNETPRTDVKGELSYEEMSALIENANFRIYRPSDYATGDSALQRLEEEKEKYHFNQETREKCLVAMMRVNFLKRLESSAHAFALTLERTIEKMETQIERIDKFRAQGAGADDTAARDIEDDMAPPEDEEDEDFIVNSKARTSYHLRELDVAQWRDDIAEDLESLRVAHEKILPIGPERDNKLCALKKRIHAQAERPNRKLLIFTAFKDTAGYLYDNLSPLAAKLGANIAMVAGDETRTTTTGEKNFNSILDHFAPKARKRGDIAPPDETQILIATDCISEGQNLQDADTVLNYDIHWNPVRLIQRFGRIDRIGSENKTVRMINFWPTDDMDAYLNLKSRVHARMALVDAAATGDENQLEEAEKSAQMEIDFRDAQIRRMREGKDIADLEEMTDSVNMSDLTLDYFLTQLLRYLQYHREDLKNTPPGVCAVVSCADKGAKVAGANRAGALFFFRQRDAGANAVQNPIHPFYLVYAEKDGIRHGYMKAGRILRLFDSLTREKTKPHDAICDAFAADIKKEEGKAFYGDMAKAALDHIQSVFSNGVWDGLTKKKKGAAAATKPTTDNLELLTWLVVREEGGE